MRSFASLDYNQQVESYKRVATAAVKACNILADPIHIEPLTFVNNATFKVLGDDGQGRVRQYALRIHQPDDANVDEIHSELRWLQAIRKDTFLNVPCPVSQTDGKQLTTLSLADVIEPFHCVLFEWIEGKFLRTSEQTPAYAYQLGQFIGELHQHSNQFSSASGIIRRCIDASGLFNWHELVASQETRQLFSQEQQQIFHTVEEHFRTVLQQIGRTPETFGLIHADLIWKNYFFHDAGAGALDFDSCSWGYYLYDLAPPLLGYRDEANYPSFRKSLLDGYRSIRPLANNHENHLDVLIATRHLLSCQWLARHLNNPTLRQNAPSIIVYRTEEMRQLMAISACNGQV